MPMGNPGGYGAPMGGTSLAEIMARAPGSGAGMPHDPRDSLAAALMGQIGRGGPLPLYEGMAGPPRQNQRGTLPMPPMQGGGRMPF